MAISTESLHRNLDEISDCVQEELLHIGIPMNILGFRYLATAVTMVAKNPAKADAMTKELYPEVASAYGTTSSRVERAMRHAIEICWERGDLDYNSKLFRHSTDPGQGKPTNGEFIARLAYKLRKEVN